MRIGRTDFLCRRYVLEPRERASRFHLAKANPPLFVNHLISIVVGELSRGLPCAAGRQAFRRGSMRTAPCRRSPGR